MKVNNSSLLLTYISGGILERIVDPEIAIINDFLEKGIYFFNFEFGNDILQLFNTNLEDM